MLRVGGDSASQNSDVEYFNREAVFGCVKMEEQWHPEKRMTSLSLSLCCILSSSRLCFGSRDVCTTKSVREQLPGDKVSDNRAKQYTQIWIFTRFLAYFSHWEVEK